MSELSPNATYDEEKPLVHRLRKLLPPVNQEWTSVDYLIQETISALSESSDGEWLPLLEMFSEKEVLLPGAAGEDAMNVGDVVKIVRELERWKQIYANACAQVVGLGVPAFGTLEEGISKLASAITPSATTSADKLADAMGINQVALNEAGWKLLECAGPAIHPNRCKEVARAILVAYINSVQRQSVEKTKQEINSRIHLEDQAAGRDNAAQRGT